MLTNIILLCIIIFLLCLIIKHKKENYHNMLSNKEYIYKTNNNQHDNSYNNRIENYNNQHNNTQNNEIENDNEPVEYFMDNRKNKLYEKKKQTVNPFFINTLFHNDYRDVMTAINNIVPDQKKVFNEENYNEKQSTPKYCEIRELLDEFMTVLNHNLLTGNYMARNENSGWDEAIQDKNMSSGWEKFRKSLGLPTALYTKPAKQSEVEVVSVTNTEKYETEFEIKYVVHLVIKKLNVEDQMGLMISFVIKKDLCKIKPGYGADARYADTIIIEEITTVGFFGYDGDMEVNEEYKEQFKHLDHGSFSALNNHDVTRDHHIIDQIMKRRHHEIEARQERINNLDKYDQIKYYT